MEGFVYYLFCAMVLLGALGVLMFRGYVNAAMSMLVSMLGVAGLMVLMGAFFPAFLMVTVYAGAVLVLFVFVVMLVGDVQEDTKVYKKLLLLFLWVCAGIFLAFCEPSLSKYASSVSDPSAENVLSTAKNYGYALFTTFMLPFQIAGALLLAAMVGVVAISRPKHRNQKTEI